MALSRNLELTPDELDDLMNTSWIGRIATIGPGDRINLTAMYFGWAGGRVYMYSRGQKVVNLRRNPNCTVHVDQNERFSELRGAMLQGKCKVLETAEEEAADPYLPGLRKLWAEKYGLKRPNPGTASGENMRWVVIVPDKIITWDNSKIAALKEKRRREKEQRQAQS
jgi:nitroimidazol reductase NimA-like FMN-containing flavoprotein (pyridoxamine 5'-phosphate oxidase superfamily)